MLSNKTDAREIGISEEIIPEKSGGETSSREMVYEGFVYPFTKIGNHVSVIRTKDRVGAAPKREGWGGRLYNPPEAACHTSPTLQNLPLTLVRAEGFDARVAE